MANTSINIANTPDLIRKLQAKGASFTQPEGERFESGEIEMVLDLTNCFKESRDKTKEADSYLVAIDSPAQLSYYCKFVTNDNLQWKISMLLPDEVINCFAAVEGDEETDFWQFKGGEPVSYDEWKPDIPYLSDIGFSEMLQPGMRILGSDPVGLAEYEITQKKDAWPKKVYGKAVSFTNAQTDNNYHLSKEQYQEHEIHVSDWEIWSINGKEYVSQASAKKLFEA